MNRVGSKSQGPQRTPVFDLFAMESVRGGAQDSRRPTQRERIHCRAQANGQKGEQWKVFPTATPAAAAAAAAAPARGPWLASWQDAGERTEKMSARARTCDKANDFLWEILNVTAADIVVLFPRCHRAYPAKIKEHNYGPN